MLSFQTSSCTVITFEVAFEITRGNLALAYTIGGLGQSYRNSRAQLELQIGGGGVYWLINPPWNHSQEY